MTSLERFKAAIGRTSYDRAPFSFSAVPELEFKLQQHFGGLPSSEIHHKIFGDDRMSASPRYIGPAQKKYEDGSYDTIFGVRMRDTAYKGGVYSEAVSNPLGGDITAKTIKRHNWPDVKDYDYHSILSPLKQNPDYPFTLGYFSLGWFAWDIRGMEQLLEDMLVAPELVHGIIEELSEYGFAYFRNIIEAGKAHIGKNFAAIHLADDLATQSGLLISPKLYRIFLKEHYRRIIDMAHSAGLLVEFHSCGSIYSLIPDLIDTGIDILNPIQTSAKDMNPERLKQEFGRDLIFSGGLDVQTVLPHGTTQEVRAETFRLLKTLGRGGGYIFQPSHSMQVDVPVENVIAMGKAVMEFYGVESPLSRLNK